MAVMNSISLFLLLMAHVLWLLPVECTFGYYRRPARKFGGPLYPFPPLPYQMMPPPFIMPYRPMKMSAYSTSYLPLRQKITHATKPRAMPSPVSKPTRLFPSYTMLSIFPKNIPPYLRNSKIPIHKGAVAPTTGFSKTFEKVHHPKIIKIQNKLEKTIMHKGKGGSIPPWRIPVKVNTKSKDTKPLELELKQKVGPFVQIAKGDVSKYLSGPPKDNGKPGEKTLSGFFPYTPLITKGIKTAPGSPGKIKITFIGLKDRKKPADVKWPGANMAANELVIRPNHLSNAPVVITINKNTIPGDINGRFVPKSGDNIHNIQHPPAGGDIVAAIADIPQAGPTFGGAGPTFGDARPTFGGAGPTFGGAGPTFGGAGPTFGSTGSTFGGAGPTFGVGLENGSAEARPEPTFQLVPLTLNFDSPGIGGGGDFNSVLTPAGVSPTVDFIADMTHTEATLDDKLPISISGVEFASVLKARPNFGEPLVVITDGHDHGHSDHGFNGIVTVDGHHNGPLLKSGINLDGSSDHGFGGVVTVGADGRLLNSGIKLEGSSDHGFGGAVTVGADGRLLNSGINLDGSSVHGFNGVVTVGADGRLLKSGMGGIFPPGIRTGIGEQVVVQPSTDDMNSDDGTQTKDDSQSGLVHDLNTGHTHVVSNMGGVNPPDFISDINVNTQAQARIVSETPNNVLKIDVQNADTVQYPYTGYMRYLEPFGPGPYGECRLPARVQCGARLEWDHVPGMNSWCQSNCVVFMYSSYCDDARCDCDCAIV